MRKTFKYRIYPTKAQKKLLRQTLEECRWVYNQTLATRKTAWEERQESLSLYDTHHLLLEWKTQRPSLKIVYSQVLQNVQARVDLAYNAFFRRVKAGEKAGYPRFRGSDRYDSLTYPQYGGFQLKGSVFSLGKIGAIKIHLHRPVEGKLKTATVLRSSTGKWYVAFSCEVEKKLLPVTEAAVGIDVGLTCFAMLSTGEQVANPRFFRQEEKALAKAQRRLSKLGNGTPERRRGKQVVARIHERVCFRRHNFTHQTARQIVDRFGVIALEDLHVTRMLKNHCLAKSIADAAWGQFATVLTGKAEEAGRQVVRVDPRNTSKRCSRCGTLVEKDLSVRVHHCPVCGLEIDRDLNAAINILAVGLHGLGLAPGSLPL
jgi:putative transposase